MLRYKLNYQQINHTQVSLPPYLFNEGYEESLMSHAWTVILFCFVPKKAMESCYLHSGTNLTFLALDIQEQGYESQIHTLTLLN